MPTTSYNLFGRGPTRALRDTDGGRPTGSMEELVPLSDGGAIGLFERVSSTGYPDFDVIPGTDQILLQRYGPDGTATGEAVAVPADEAGLARNALMLGLPGGGVVVAWAVRADETGGEAGVRVRWFDAELNPLGEGARPFAALEDGGSLAGMVLDEAAGEVVLLAEGAGDGADLGYARLALSDGRVTETGTIEGAGPGGRLAASVGADGALTILLDQVSGMTVWPAGITLADQGGRQYAPVMEALPDGGYVAGFIDQAPDNAESARIVFLDADGTPRGDGTLLAKSDPNQVFQLPDHATRDLNIDVLPSGHVVTTHLASFTLTSGDVPVVNVFSPEGDRLLRDLVLDDVGTYFDVTTGVADGAVTVSYYDADARTVVARTVDVVRETRADGPAGDRLNGDGLADDIYGGTGADTVFAGGGDDVVLAGGGDDEVDAGDGDDLVEGGGGGDLIEGGAGADVIYGDLFDGGA